MIVAGTFALCTCDLDNSVRLLPMRVSMGPFTIRPSMSRSSSRPCLPHSFLVIAAVLPTLLQLVRMTREEVERPKLGPLVTVEAADLFTADLGKADVVTLYVGRDVNRKLVPQLQKLRPGSPTGSSRRRQSAVIVGQARILCVDRGVGRSVG